LGQWGAGRVELMQFNAGFEYVDNAVSYWVSERTPAVGEPFDIAWRLHWERDSPQRPPLARVMQTRRGHGPTPHPPDELHFTVDFSGGRAGSAPAEAFVEADGPVEILETHLQRHPVRGGWRMTVKVRRSDKAAAAELRAVLRQGPRVLSETWLYALPPQ
jgi:periplasmic glucans biosynthesis protein